MAQGQKRSETIARAAKSHQRLDNVSDQRLILLADSLDARAAAEFERVAVNVEANGRGRRFGSHRSDRLGSETEMRVACLADSVQLAVCITGSPNNRWSESRSRGATSRGLAVSAHPLSSAVMSFRGRGAPRGGGFSRGGGGGFSRGGGGGRGGGGFGARSFDNGPPESVLEIGAPSAA